MKMPGDPRAGGIADVHAEIHSLGAKLTTHDVRGKAQLVGERGVLSSPTCRRGATMRWPLL